MQSPFITSVQPNSPLGEEIANNYAHQREQTPGGRALDSSTNDEHCDADSRTAECASKKENCYDYQKDGFSAPDIAKFPPAWCHNCSSQEES